MPQIKVEKNDHYTRLDNGFIQNQEISLKAKGLLAYMLSLPDDWDYSISGLSVKCKEGKSSIRSAIDELMEHRYITRSLVRAKNGTLGGYEYVVYEEPQPSCENPTSVNPMSENCTQQINNLTNKEKTNTPYSPPEGDAPPVDSDPEDKPRTKSKRTRRKKSVPDHAPERFEQFWAYYPEPSGSRLKAVEEWDALAPSDELIDEMARALRRQKASRQWQEGVGIPHACRWIRDRRWTDKLSEAPQSQGPGGWAPDPEVT